MLFGSQGGYFDSRRVDLYVRGETMQRTVVKHSSGDACGLFPALV